MITIENPIPVTSIHLVSAKDVLDRMPRSLSVCKSEFKHLPLRRVMQVIDFDCQYKPYGYNYMYLCQELGAVFITRNPMP